jgi:hypothetical protein
MCKVFFWNRSKSRKNHFSWKRIGKMFPKAPDRIENVRVTGEGFNRTIRKILGAERRAYR